ncbi:MAG: PAS domain S-box protein, partial [Desulfobacterales bacterium]|nr:PAS domain S-box protein [Desulfobacterales bacterium]
MKPFETIGHLEVRNLLAIGVCCFLAVFIGGMLTREYISRDRMFQDHIHALDQSLEKRASAVSYFFSERLADLEHLGSARELNGYFENMALGMSMRYGLKSSLFSAARQFFLLLKTKHINGEPIYSRLLYVTEEGEILIDTKGAPDDFPPFFADLLTPGGKKERIIGDGSIVAVSLPFYFKKRVAGRLISMIEVDTIERHLVRQSVDAGGFYSLNLTAAPLVLGGKTPLLLDGSDQLTPSWFEGRHYRMVEGTWAGAANARVIVMRAEVTGTPFSIISMRQSDTMSGTSVFAIMAAFALFIGTGIFFIWRTATQRLIVGVRLQASRQSERHFRDLVEFLPLPVGEYGFDLKMKYANREAKIFFGYTQDDIDAGVSVTELVQEKDLPRAMDRIGKLQAGENPGPIEINARCRDGRKIYGKAIPSLVYENGAISGVRTCFIDMTQQLKSEKETRIAAEQEKYALVGQVAGKMAHDFNNILGAIMGNADLALLDCKDKEIQDTFEIILEQAKRGNILTRNLVAFAKDQEIKEEYFNINQKLDLVLNLLKKELDGITVIKNYQKDPPELLADPGMIEHALVNLIQNAIHAMGKTEHPVLGLDTRSTAHKLTITIQDNGCGIPEAYAKDIYSPSFTL